MKKLSFALLFLLTQIAFAGGYSCQNADGTISLSTKEAGPEATIYLKKNGREFILDASVQTSEEPNYETFEYEFPYYRTYGQMKLVRQTYTQYECRGRACYDRTYKKMIGKLYLQTDEIDLVCR